MDNNLHGRSRTAGFLKPALIVICAIFGAESKPALTFRVIGEHAADAGSQRTGDNEVRFTGSGSGIVKKDDNLLFFFGTPTGDFTLDVYCALIDDTLSATECGLMIRSDTVPDASCIALLIRHELGMTVKYRTSQGKNVKTVDISPVIHNYLRIRRSGNGFYLYSKPAPEAQWMQLGASYTFNWPAALCAGVVHHSGDSGRVTSSRFNAISGLPGEFAGGASCEPVLYDFENGVPLPTLGFREIDRWVLDTGRFIRSSLQTDSAGVAHILTPPVAVPLGFDTVSASWDLFFDGDTAPRLQDYGLFATEALSLNHRAKITAPRIGSAAKVISGADDTLYTAVFALDSVLLYDRTRVFGNVTTGRSCRLINGAAVYGVIAENASYAPPSIPVFDVDTGTVSPTVAAGDSLDCVPGSYGTLTAYAGAKIRLICNPEVKLHLAADSTRQTGIMVRTSLQIADRCTTFVSGPAAARRTIRVYAHQSAKIDLGANLKLYGYYLAPNAEVRFVSRGTIIDGGLYARKISFEPDVAVTVNGNMIGNDRCVATLHPKNGAEPAYSISTIIHSSALQDTMADIVITRDTSVTVASFATGAPTPFGKWLSLRAEMFRSGAQNRLRLLYDNGSGAVEAVDTLALDMDTLSGISFDHRKADLMDPVAARIDNIAFSCAADSCPPVVIVTQPEDTTVYEGRQAVPYANQPSYSVGAAALSDNGAVFSCRIAGACDTAETGPAVLTVVACEPPQISAQPLDDTVMLGHAATFTVTAQGTGLSYLWKRNDDSIGTAAGPSYTVPAVQPYNNLDRYSVEVTNGCGAMSRSRDALLVIPDAGPCRITGHPAGDTLLEGDYFRTSVTATCEGGTFVWLRNGAALAGATSANLLYGPVTIADNGSGFVCIAANSITADTSATAYLVVRSPNAAGGSIAISGTLLDGNGDTIGSPNPESFDFTAKLFTRKTGGEPVYIERFESGGGHGVWVDHGAFTVTLGTGNASDSLQKVTASHRELHAELRAGRNGGLELIAPRLRLTAAPYAFTAGVKVVYGEGPPAPAMSAPAGTMYVDRSDGNVTWKLAKSGWVKLDPP